MSGDPGKKSGFAKIARKIKRAILRDDPEYYDMFENGGERYFGRLYLHEINRILREQECKPPMRMLDAGCQTGRISIPLAKAGHRMTGVDTSDVALCRAARHAKAQGVSMELIRSDLGKWLPKQPAASYDAVLCTEVLYLRNNHRELLRGLLRLLKPGGLCFISHRPAAYYLIEASEKKDWEAVRTVLTANEGKLFGSYYNWQDRGDLESLYRELGVEPLAVTSIGFLSWLKVNPEKMDDESLDLLFQLETDPRYKAHNGGRYLLFSGRKLHR